jgi:hypothetical protein
MEEGYRSELTLVTATFDSTVKEGLGAACSAVDASFLRFFDRAELEDAARILLGGDRPVAGAVPQEALEVRPAGFGYGRLVHILDRAELLNRHVSPHLSN